MGFGVDVMGNCRLPSISSGSANRTLESRVVPPGDFVGVESALWLFPAGGSRRRNRGGDSGCFSPSWILGDDGGRGIVGIEYSFGKICVDPEEVVGLCPPPLYR